MLTGSYDAGDPLTTNIHVAGLPQHVTEQSLGMFFAQYGPIGSVKVRLSRCSITLDSSANLPANDDRSCGLERTRCP